jgi:hypothetical protein
VIRLVLRPSVLWTEGRGGGCKTDRRALGDVGTSAAEPKNAFTLVFMPCPGSCLGVLQCDARSQYLPWANISDILMAWKVTAGSS